MMNNNKTYNGIKVSGANCIQISGEAEKTIGSFYAKIDEVEAYNRYLASEQYSNKNICFVGKNWVV